MPNRSRLLRVVIFTCRVGLAVLILIVPLLLPGLAASDAAPSPAAGWAPALAEMTLEEKVGQLFLVTLYSSTLDQADRALISAILPGGVVLFPQNLGMPEQVTGLVNALQAHALTLGAGLPLLVAVDQEGGRVTRLGEGFTRFSTPLVLGATGSREDAVLLGDAMGQEMAAVGINMNLAPVADLQNPTQDHSETQVLYRRTLSADPALVGLLAGGLVEGMRQAGVIGVLKHYPGHGAAIQDSHNGLPEVDLSLDEVENAAIKPFEIAFADGAPAVMIGHLYYPALDPNVRRPATLSPVVIGHLRNNIGFDGLVISDAMDMGAILDEYTLSEAIVEAVNAGVDLIAFGPHVTALDQRRAAAAVLQAVRTGTIAQARLDEAVAHSLTVRAQYGLMDWTPLEVAATAQRLRLADHQDTLRQLAADAVTLLDDPAGLLPLDAGQKVMWLYPADYADIGLECTSYFPGRTVLGYNDQPEDWEIDNAVRRAASADVVVVFIEDLTRNRQRYQLVWALPAEKTVAVVMRSPYDWELLPVPLSTVVLTYDSTPETRAAACRAITGAAPFSGRLPVPVGPYPVGSGRP